MLKRSLAVILAASALLLPPAPTAVPHASAPVAAGDRTFLVYDPTGDGRAVEVVGDLATATRIVIFIPGSDTTLRDFDRGLGGVARRAPAVNARAIYGAVSASPQVAVVAWLGYDPPEGLGLAAFRQDRAAAGAAALTGFVSTLPPHATVVVVGHSYGSVVMALAAPDLGPQVTDLVALGSPGLGDISTSARLWVATAPTDWIRRVPKVSLAGFGHGPIPATARPLPTEGVAGHDSYLEPGSTTLAAIAKLIASAP